MFKKHLRASVPQYLSPSRVSVNPYTKYLLQFRTGIKLLLSQHDPSPWKQTLLITSPSAAVGWPPSNQPGYLALQRPLGGHVSGMKEPASPVKRYHFCSMRESSCLEMLELLTCLSAELSSVYDLQAVGSAAI